MIRPQEIAFLAEVAFGVDAGTVYSDSQSKAARAARTVTYRLISKHLQWSDSRIGRRLQRDPSTVGHGLKTVEQRMAQEADFATIVGQLDAAIEFRILSDMRRDRHALEIAETIVRNPRRQAMAASVYEIASVAQLLVELWEVARVGEAIVGAIAFSENNIELNGPYNPTQLFRLCTAYEQHMDQFRKPSNPNNEDPENEQSV